MKITKKGEYALKALLALAAQEGAGTLALREISKIEDIPFKFLEQIMITLKRAGFVESVQGKNGGYFLSEPSDQITLGEIIRTVDGPLAPLGSGKDIKKRMSRETRNAGLYATLLEVGDAISEILDKKTLKDILEKNFELSHAKEQYHMYYI